MLVFIDESGDTGFKFQKGSSKNFVLAMVSFQSNEDALNTECIVDRLMVEQGVKPEWKFSHIKDIKRDAFFREMSQCNFQCSAIVVQKDLIESHILRTKPLEFYRFFTRYILEHSGTILTGAKIVIDGSGDRRFKKKMQTYLKSGLEQGAIKRLSFQDSRKDLLVQLADMCAGAIAWSYSDKPNASRWREQLESAGKLQRVLEFK